MQREGTYPKTPRAADPFGGPMGFSTLLAIAAAFFVFAASPSPDTMTIAARTISQGAASGIA